MEITHSRLTRLLGVAREARQTVFVRGGVGIGKSQCVVESGQARAKAIGRRFVEWNKLGAAAKAELAGSPNLAAEVYISVDIRLALEELGSLKIPQLGPTEYIRWAYSDALVALSHPDSAGMLFLDEFNQAPRAVLGSCYQLVLDRSLGSLHLADGAQVVAAGNRQLDKCGVTDLQPALVNRVAIVNLKRPDARQWANWAADNGVRPDVSGYILQHPCSLYAPDGVALQPDTPFPTPRAWAAVSRMLDAMAVGRGRRAVISEEDAFEAAAGLVGDGEAFQFAAFVAQGQKMDLDALLDNPKSFEGIGRKPDGTLDVSLRWAAICGVASRAKSEQDSLKEEAGKPGADKADKVPRKPWRAMTVGKAVNLLRHVEEGELAIELVRFLKASWKDKTFVAKISGMAAPIPYTRPWEDADPDGVPKELRGEFKELLRRNKALREEWDLRQRVMHFVHLMDKDLDVGEDNNREREAV